MKRLLLSVLVLVPTAAWATPGDSTLGPFKLPLQLGVIVHGSFIPGCAQEAPSPPGDSFGFIFTITQDSTHNDTTWVHRDTLTYSFESTNFDQGRSDVTARRFDIIIDTNSKTIVAIQLRSDWSSSPSNGPYPSQSEDWYVKLSGFSYDSSGIFSDDPLLTSHFATCYYFYEDQEGAFLTDASCSMLGTVTSIDLIGIFKLSHLVFSTVLPSKPMGNMTIKSLLGSRECVFPTSNHSRSMELYTPLGAKAASLEIAPWQSEVELPHLPSGLYFLRLDSQFLKVAIP